MLTLARNFCTRLMPMEGVADASATGRSARSPPDPISSSGQIDHIEERTPSARRDAPLGRVGTTRSEHLLSCCRRHQRCGRAKSLGRPRSSLLFPPRATRSVRKHQMKRGSEEGDEAKEAKKPKEDAKAPAPAPAPVKEDEPPVCNVGNLLEICDQDVDFAVELVGEGGQEMTGHAAKAVQQATNMEGGWLTTVRKSDFKRPSISGLSRSE